MSIFFNRLYKAIAGAVRSSGILISVCLPVYRAVLGLFARDVLLTLLLSRVREKDVVYDIGAFEGSYSLAIAGRFDQILVYAFEPNPAAYKRLVKNIAHRKLVNKIIPLNIAVSNKRGTAQFYISAYPPLSSLHPSHAAFRGATSVAETVDVQCDTIDNMVQKGTIRPPKVIKIDTEGHELQVIQGAQDTIGRFQPSVGFEPHGTKEEQGIIAESIRGQLSALGYSCRPLGDIRYSFWCQVPQKL